MKSSYLAFSEANEDSIEEILKLSESEEEDPIFFENLHDYSSLLDENLAYDTRNASQMNQLVANNYKEPNQENLFSPPEMNV